MTRRLSLQLTPDVAWSIQLLKMLCKFPYLTMETIVH